MAKRASEKRSGITWPEPLKGLQKEQGLSTYALAKRAGLSHQSMYKYLEGAIPDAPYVLRIARAFEVSIEWLLTGRDAPSVTTPHIITFAHDDPTMREEFASHEDADSFIPVRILGDAAAMGPGRKVASGKTAGYALIHEVALPRIARTQKRSDEQIVCLWARGESMEPTIQDGSLVAVDRRKRGLQNGKIYLVHEGDDAVTIKRVSTSRGGHLVVTADNPATEGYPLVLSGKDADNAICGKVVWWWSRQR